MLTAVSDVQQYLLWFEDVVVVEQWRVLCFVDSGSYTTFAFTVTGTHDSNTTVFQYRLHIIEVKVDDTAHSDDFSDTLGSDKQGVVCLRKSTDNGKVRIDLAQLFVVDNQQSIYILTDFFHTVQGLVNLLVAFPTEWNGYDSYG